MVEDGSATSGRKRSGDSYVHEWNRFVAWSEAGGRRYLPFTTADARIKLKSLYPSQHLRTLLHT